MKKPTQSVRPVDLNTVESARTMLQVFTNIADAWGVTVAERQVLLGLKASTYYRYLDGQISAGLDSPTMERLSYVVRIYAALEILLPMPERAHAWVKSPNTAPLFGGRSALSRMLGGQVGDLMVVADYLDAQRGGDFS